MIGPKRTKQRRAREEMIAGVQAAKYHEIVNPQRTGGRFIGPTPYICPKCGQHRTSKIHRAHMPKVNPNR